MPALRRAPTRQRPLSPRLGTRFLRPAAGPTGYGTIVPRTATVAQTASGTSITGTLPTDRQPGDYVIAHFGMTCTPAQFTRPSAGDGWVQLIAPTDNGSSETVAVYGMFTPTVAPTGASSAAANRQTCIMQAYGVVDPTTPIDVTGTVTTGLLPLTVAEVTTVTPGARLISGSIGDFSTGTWNTPAGMTIVGTHTSGTGRGAALADELRVSAGATGTRQWSASVSALNSAGYQLALRPAPVPVVREYLAGEASAVNISVTTAANTQAGDLILAFHSNDFNTAANVTPPTTGTWVLKATGDNGTDASHVKVWSSSAAGGAQTITVAPTVSGEEHALHVVVFAGACTTDGAAGGNGSATASHVSPAVSPAGAAGMLFTLATSNGAVAGNYTAPAGMTERTEVDDVTFAFTASLADQYLAGSGSTGTRTWTYSTTGGYATVTVAVKAPAGGGTDYTATPTDDTGLTDTTAVAIAQTITDSTGLTDTSTAQVVKDVTQTDSAGLTDSAEKTLSQAQTDSAGLTDTQAAQLTKTQTDSAGLTDTTAVELSKLLTQTDDTGLTDSAIRSIAQAVTDDTGLTDTTTLSRSATQTDSTGLTDTATVVSAKSIDQTDSAGLTDTFTLRRDLVPTDSTGLTDTAAAALTKAQTDNAGLTDTASAGLVRDVTATDGVGLTDTWALSRTLSITDLAGLTDTQAMTRLAVLTDDAGLTDSAVPVLGSFYVPAYVGVDGGTTTAGGLDGTATTSGALDGHSGPGGILE